MNDAYEKLNTRNESNNNNHQIKERFFNACHKGNAKEVEISLNELRDNQIDVNSKNQNAYSGFLLACESGNLPVVRFLATQSDINIKDTVEDSITLSSCNALTIACSKKHTEVVKELLSINKWANIKLLASRSNGNITRILNAEIFLRSTEKKAKNLRTKSYKSEKYISAAKQENEFIKVRIEKIKPTMNEKQGLLFEQLINSALKPQSPLTSPSAFVSNFSSNFTNSEPSNNNNTSPQN